MSNIEFNHTDRDGDTLKVWGGDSGAVIEVEGDESMVAVNFDALPKLIETLQAILAEEQGESPKVEDDEDLTVLGWGAVDPEGRFITNFSEQQRAINYVDDARRMAKAAGLDSNYRVAAIVDQGGL